MDNWIIKKFVNNYEDTKNPEVRERYGSVAGAVGIISNIIICSFKIAVGILFGSIAILADGINNLSDASASLITMLGFKLASKKPDKDHPYGHGRTEYLTGLAISIMIIVIGYQLLKSSIQKTISPEPIDFSWLSVIVLVVSILVKLWQAGFNKKVGRAINSDALMATAADSRNDVISTSAVLISTLLGGLFNINVDGPMGILVAGFILFSGISLVKETIAPILGQPPDKDIVKSMAEIILADKDILGIHDLMVHDYGPGRLFASVHVEVDGSEDIFIVHDRIDNIEKQVMDELGILLTIHMDPVVVGNPLVEEVKGQLENIASSVDGIINLHDVRVVEGPTHTNIVFDVVRTDHCKLSNSEVKEIFSNKLKEINPKYIAVMTIDNYYL